MQAMTGATVFDGRTLHADATLLVDGAKVVGIAATVPDGATEIRLDGGILSPGFLDLQVNGGGGHMVDRTLTMEKLSAICATHIGLGTTGILPTLITDTPEALQHVVKVAADATGMPGFLGLHLEGPHLDPRRQGAHDPALIRPMQAADLDLLVWAAARLPSLMVTLAPAAATPQQIEALTEAGIIVSLGHSECTLAEAEAAIAAGARCATHLFNAMSQLGNREPGLVGAVLTHDISAGLIADGIHVSPATIRIALAARPEGLFLVSDCMAATGTDETEFFLGGRRILRHDGRLTLEDGTLAGADLTLARAVEVMVRQVGLSVDRALSMATRVPASVIGREDLGNFAAGTVADIVHLDSQFRVSAVWKAGQKRA